VKFVGVQSVHIQNEILVFFKFNFGNCHFSKGELNLIANFKNILHSKTNCTLFGSEKEFSSIIFADVSTTIDEPNGRTLEFKPFIEISKFSVTFPKFTICKSK
jgi:hypothetical protein